MRPKKNVAWRTDGVPYPKLLYELAIPDLNSSGATKSLKMTFIHLDLANTK